MLSAKISSKGQLTLPRHIRQALGVKPGERVLFVVQANTVALQAMGASSARVLAGSLRRYARARKSTGPSRRAVKKEVARAAAQEG